MSNVIPSDFLKNEETKFRLWDDVFRDKYGHKGYRSKHFPGYEIVVRSGFPITNIHTLYKDGEILAVGSDRFAAFQKLQEDTGNLMYYIDIKNKYG